VLTLKLNKTSNKCFWKIIKYKLVLFSIFQPEGRARTAASAQLRSAYGLLGCSSARQQPGPATQPRATVPRAQAATWAWAGKAASRLGHIWPGTLSAVDLRVAPSNGYACASEEQNRPRQPAPLTLIHFVLSRSHLFTAAPEGDSGGGPWWL
jgi:hypothetical protein